MNWSRVLSVIACLLAFAVVWVASPELPDPMRALTAFLLTLFPAALVVQARQLQAAGEIPRRTLYINAIISLWMLAAATLVVARMSGVQYSELGLRSLPWLDGLLWTVGVIIVAEAVVIAGHLAGVRSTDTLRNLLPVTTGDRIGFTAVAATAGICEEIVFRGFLLTALIAATQSPTLAILLAALAFGVVHAYQDPPGIGVAALVALVLTAPVLATGSLYPAIAAHFVIDIIGGFWLGPRLLRQH